MRWMLLSRILPHEGAQILNAHRSLPLMDDPQDGRSIVKRDTCDPGDGIQSVAEMRGRKMNQQRDWGRTQDSRPRPTLVNKLPPYIAPGRKLWLVMNSLPFRVVDEAKAQYSAIFSTFRFSITPIGAIGLERQNILERLDTCSSLISFHVPADDVLGHQGAVIPEQERKMPSPQLQHGK